MYQQQVNNNNNNNISSTLDCCESRTVRTINAKEYLQRQQQPTVKVLTCGVAPLVSALDFTTESVITGKKSTQMQSVCQAHSLKWKPMMKTFALLPIICIIICAQISTTSGRTLPGRRQFLHTLRNRMQHRINLMGYERANAPKLMQARHHRIVRSNDQMMCPENFEHFLTKLKYQSNASHQTLKGDIDTFTKVRFNNVALNANIEWNMHNLNLEHPYSSYINRTFDTKGHQYNFPHLENQAMSTELFRAEMFNILKTLRTLKIVYNDTVTDNNQNEWKGKYQQHQEMINFLEKTYDELTKTEQYVKLILHNPDVPRTTAKYNESAQVREWLLVVESVSFLEYLTQLCQKIMEMCK